MYRVHRNLHDLTHPFPTRRSSDLAFPAGKTLHAQESGVTSHGAAQWLSLYHPIASAVHQGSAEHPARPAQPHDRVRAAAAATAGVRLCRHAEVRNIDIAVHNQDAGRWSHELVTRLDRADFITQVHRVTDSQELRRLIDQGKVIAALDIQPDFSRAIAAGDTGRV